MKDNNLEKIHTIWFQLYDFLLKRQKHGDHKKFRDCQIVIFHLVICISCSSMCLHCLILHFFLVLHNNPLSGCTIVWMNPLSGFFIYWMKYFVASKVWQLWPTMAPHSSTLAWKIPWTEEPGGLQSMGSLRVGRDWATSFHFSLSCIGEGNGNPLQCSCLVNPRDGGAWWAAFSGVAQSQTRLKQLSSSSHFLYSPTLTSIHDYRKNHSFK